MVVWLNSNVFLNSPIHTNTKTDDGLDGRTDQTRPDSTIEKPRDGIENRNRNAVNNKKVKMD